MTTFTCERCNQVKANESTFTTGYALVDGMKVCYHCCADLDREYMATHGRITLYLTKDKVTNWPGTLEYQAQVRKGRHNIARTRYDAWFTDDQGNRWHGVQYGENTQLIHCRRLSH